MSRRSLRLLTSGYYCDGGEMDERNVSRQMSYRESPAKVFKKRTVSRILLNIPDTDGSCSSGSPLLAPTWRKSKFLSRSQRTSSSKMISGNAEHGMTSLMHVLFACLARLCCSLFDFIRDALPFSSHTLRKPALTVLILTMFATGFWIFYPNFTPVLISDEPAWSEYRRSSLDVMTDPMTAMDLSGFREGVLDRINKAEAGWQKRTRELNYIKQNIGLLRNTARKNSDIFEILRKELSELKNVAKLDHFDCQSSVTETVNDVAKDIAAFEKEMSNLRAAHHYHQQLLEVQANTNAQLKEDLTDLLKQELQAGFKLDAGNAILRPELQEALEALEKRLLQRLAEEVQRKHGDVWRAAVESLKNEGLGAITVTEVHDIVQRALSLYKADGTGMADYALESGGASVIRSQSSETYHTRSACLSLFGVPLWYASESPRTVIQPEVHPGRCWAFKGSQGLVTIALSVPVRVTHVTLEHIPRSLSPTGRIDSAPRDFAIYGLSGSDEQGEGTLLGRFTYNSDGEPIQTFELPDSGKDVYGVVQLRVLSNWGSPDYSCIYRFRVHGQPLPH